MEKENKEREIAEKLIIKNNIKIAEILGWKVDKDFKKSIVYGNPNYPKDPRSDFEFTYHSDWNVLIETFWLFKQWNLHLWFSEFSVFNTGFLLGVTANDIAKSYSALVSLSNHKKFKNEPFKDPYINKPDFNMLNVVPT